MKNALPSLTLLPGAGVFDRPRPRLAPRFVAAVDTAPTVRTSAESLVIPADILDGGEIVLLAIKPSLWFVVFDSARWIVVGALLLILAAVTPLRPIDLSVPSITQLAFLIMAGRMGVGLLRWVSQFYVLTNRRIMRLRGVFKADIHSCPLLRIRRTGVSVGLHERITNLGTIHFFVDAEPNPDLHWRQVAHADEVHDRIRRAIDRLPG